MKIVKTFALGAAGALMISGSAMAADPPPVIMPAMPAPVATGPDITLDVGKLVVVGAPFGFGTLFDAYLNVEWPAGWGIEIDGNGGSGFAPFSFGGSAEFRFYRAFGGFQAGAGFFAGGGCFPCNGGILGLNASLFYDYEGDRLTVDSENYLFFFPSLEFFSYTEIEFQVNEALLLEMALELDGGIDYASIAATYSLSDRLDIWASLDFFGPLYAGFGAEFELSDVVTLWAEAYFVLGGGLDEIGFGADFTINDWMTVFAAVYIDPVPFGGVGLVFQRPIGTGPLSLVGYGQVFYGGGGFGFGAGLGIRYSIGDVDDYDDWFEQLFDDTI